MPRSQATLFRPARVVVDSLRNRRVLRVVVSILFCSIGLPRSTEAGTIRHDRNPQAYLDLAAKPEFGSVGRLDVTEFAAGTPSLSSGVLVAPDWVVTVGHAVLTARTVEFNVQGETHAASRWVVHPKFDTKSDFRGYDIALVQLATPVSIISPASLYRGHRELGQPATFVGYGYTGTGLTGDIDHTNVRRAGTNMIDGTVKLKKGVTVFSQKLPRAARYFSVDFDNPEPFAGIRENAFGSPTPTNLEYMASLGDSGGGAFVTDPATNASLLAGLIAFSAYSDDLNNADYGDVTTQTRVSKFAKWMDQVIRGSRQTRKLHFVTPTPVTIDEMASLSLFATDSATGAYGAAVTSEQTSSAVAVPLPVYGPFPLILAAAGIWYARHRLGARRA